MVLKKILAKKGKIRACIRARQPGVYSLMEFSEKDLKYLLAPEASARAKELAGRMPLPLFRGLIKTELAIRRGQKKN